eukprot:COSAG06_NODE_18874_length_864_cov_1.048366_1_plen_126_part_10
MSEAVEGAECMLYGVSEKYKESANCRLELNYGSQVLDDDQLIPLMMQKDYRATGWLGLILGTKLWYEFYPAAVDTQAKFDRQIDSLVRAIGDRGKTQTTTTTSIPGSAVADMSSRMAEGVPPAPAP